MSDQHWGVVGGGMLGMTLALRLREAGHRVTLFEAADHLGGLASAWQLGDVVWDKHYHVILLSDSHLRAVLRQLGLDDQISWVETRTGCYAGGELYSVSNTIEFLRFPPLRMIDKLRLGWTVFFAARVKDWKKLEQIPIERWLVRHSGQRTFDEFWKPLLRSKLGDNYGSASASFIWAIIQRLYAARRSGLKKEMFGYVPGGYARILDVFAAALHDRGVEVRLGSRVTEVARSQDGIEVRCGDASTAVDRVVVTAAAPIAGRLIPQLTDSERLRMERISYQGIVCASVLTRNALAEYYVTNITDDWVPFTGVIEMSALVDRSRFNGNNLVYLPKYTVEGDPAARWSDDEVRERFLAALERMYPAFDRSDVIDFKVSRVRYVLPVATLRYSEGVPDVRSSVPGVFTVNSSQILNGTLNVNETVQLAEQAIPILLDEVSTAAVADAATTEAP